MREENTMLLRPSSKLAYLLLACFMAIAVMAIAPQNAEALTKKEIQAKMVQTLYNGKGGYLSTDFHGYRTQKGIHEGIDFSIAPGDQGMGTPIYSLSSGKVISVFNDSLRTFAIYDSVNNKTVIYLHCKPAVSVGDEIRHGQLIGYEWNYDTVGNAHVHVEVRDGYRKKAALSVDNWNPENPDPYPYWEKIFSGSPDPDPDPDPNNPKGNFDFAYSGKGTLRVGGWAFDPNSTSESIKIHVYIGGDIGVGEGHIITANTARSDVNTNHGISGNHGFESVLNTTKEGKNDVYVYAINVGAGSDNTFLGKKTVNIASGNPVGCLDWVTGGKGNVTVKGWAFDPNTMGEATKIHVYVGAPAEQASKADNTAILTANIERTDVDAVYGCGANHGFRGTVATGLTGNVSVYVYAINTGAGSGSVLLGKRTVAVSPDSEGPAISDFRIENITKSGYDVSCVASDDNGIEKVLFPTWSEVDGQDDIVWHQATFENGRYTYHVSIYDHQGNRGFYNTHAYAYDKSGNEGSATANDILVPQAVASLNGSTYYLADMKYFDSSFTYDKIVGKTSNNGVNYRLARAGDEETLEFLQEFAGNAVSGKTVYWIGGSSDDGVSDYLALDIASGEVVKLDNAGGSIGCANMGFIYENPGEDKIAPTVSDVAVVDVDETGYTVSCKVSDSEGIARVQFKSWTGLNSSGSDGGRDDEVLSDASVVDGVATLRIETADHNNESGMYQTIIYAYDLAGNQTRVVVKDLAGDILVPSAHIWNGNDEYYLYEVSAAWAEASEYASAMGGHLAFVSNAEENSLIHSLITNEGSLKSAYWLGGSDSANEGSFFWTDGSSLDYENWNSGEPNDGDSVEDYIAMDASSGSWCDYPVEGKAYDWSNMGFVVEVNNDTLPGENTEDGVFYEVALPEGENYSARAEAGYFTHVEEGFDYVFTVSPSSGYQVDSVLANGIALEPGVDALSANVSSGATYVIESVQEDTFITVEVSEVVQEDELIDIANASVSAIADQVYTGHLALPGLSVSYDGLALTEDVDYRVSYSNNVEVGQATATLVGIGAYEGTLEVSFDIVKAQNGVELSNVSDWVEGEEPAPASVKADFGEPSLVYATSETGDYTQAAPTAAGTYYVKAVVAEADNWFAGESDPVEFKVLRKVPMPSAKTGLVYNGSEQVGISSSDDYSISGRSSAAGAGSYVATVVPAEGCAWEDGTTDRLRISWAISRAKLTATYADEAVAWGEEPKLSVKVTGFVGGEDAATAAGYKAPTVVAPAEPEQGASYELTPAGGAADNYSFDYVSGTLSYGKEQTPVAPDEPEDSDKVIAVPGAETGLSYTGSKQVGVAAGEGYTLSGTASASVAGSYVATATLSDGYVWADGSYGAKKISWSIAPAKLVATYAGESVAWGAAPALSVSVTGFVGGENADTAAGYKAPTVAAPENPVQGGSYELVPSGGAADNYAFQYEGGMLSYGFEEKPAKVFSDAKVTLSFEECVYDGSVKAPSVSVTHGEVTLVEGVDYQVAYDSGRVLPGIYYVTVTGMGEYQGAITRAFVISKLQVAVPDAASGLVYTGAKQVGVAAGEGYTLSGTASSKHAGSYVATATLAEGYAWSDGSTDAKSISWSIAPAKLTASYAGESIAWDEVPKLLVEVTGFVGGETEDTASGYEAPAISIPGAAVEPGTNYVLAPAGGKADDYFFKYASGMLKVGAKETVISIESAELSLSDSSFVYDGKVKTPSATVVVSGKQLTEGVDYRLVYDDGRKRSGVYDVTVIGMGAYTGSVTTSFEIVDATLAASNVTMSYSTAAYSGSAKKPAATVKVNGVTQLKAEYSVTYWNKAKAKQVSPVNVGTYWVKVEAKDSANTSGVVWKKLTVNPKATASLKLTRLNNGFKASWAKRTVQCSGYQVAYKQVGTTAWKYKTVTGYKTNVKSVTGLKDKKSYQVKVRTYKTVNGVKYYSVYTPVKTVKTK